MLRKLLFTLCIVLASWSLALAQTGRLKGVIKDKDTGETIPFANVVLENGGTQVGGASSDFDGNYDINPIPPGTYDLKATFVGYNTFIMKGIVVSANKITFQDISLSMQSEVLDAVEIVDYKVPLISKDQTSAGATITAEEIAKMPNRSAEAVAATVGGVFSADVRSATCVVPVQKVQFITLTVSVLSVHHQSLNQLSTKSRLCFLVLLLCTVTLLVVSLT